MPTFSGESLAAWTDGEWKPSPPTSPVEGISTDTRSLLPGNVYVALEGENFDGHDFVQEAFDKGAIGTVVRSGSQSCSDEAGRQLYVRDTLTALRDLAMGYRKEVGPRIVAITGSVGKSTVKEMTASMLCTALPTASTIGNWNNHVGVPLSVLAMERTTEVGVFEVAMSRPGEIAHLCELLEPSCGIVTNVGAAHLESFDSVADILQEKCELLRCLPADGIAVLCLDNECHETMRSAVSGRVITVSTRADADYTCVNGLDDNGTVNILEKKSGDRVDIRMPVPGEHNVRNAMMAIATAREYEVGWDGIRSGLRAYCPLPMRWAEETVGGVVLINDAYNANPMSMRAALDTFAAMHLDGRKWLVLADMRELGDTALEEHIELGRLIAGGEWDGLLTVGEMALNIAAGAEEAGYEGDRVVRCMACRDAAEALFKLASEGDAVLLKASRAMHLEDVAVEYRALFDETKQ